MILAGTLSGITFASPSTAATVQPTCIPSHNGVASQSVATMIARGTSGLAENKSYLKGWREVVQTSDWYFSVARRLKELSSKQNGWKGVDSVAPRDSSLKSAHVLLRKLAQEGIDRRPAIGLDHEGTFSFLWLDTDVKADLTVYDDGTYSFFVKSDGHSASVDDASITEPLDSRLLGALLS